MGGDEFAQAFDFHFTRFDGCLDRDDVAFDDDRHVSTAEFLLADDFDIRRFAGGVDRFEDGGEALRFN